MVELFEPGTGAKAARIFRIGALAGLGAGLAAVLGVHLASAPLQAEDKAYWRVSGPPCRAATAADLALIGRPLDQSFEFEAARFSRIGGAAFCSGLTEGGPFRPTHYDVCQFNSPRAVTVTAAGRLHAFQIQGGVPATVTVSRDGGTRCVTAAHFRGE